MICVKSLHLRLNRTLLLVVGLWPYERSILVQLQLILLYGIVITFIMFQFTMLATSKCSLQFVIEVLSSVTSFITFMIKYSMFCFNMDTMRQLLEILQHIYDELKDKNEIEIIKKYTIIAERCTGAVILLFMSVVPILIFPCLWPYILDVSSINKSQSHNTIRTDYFIGQEKYSYLIEIHASAAYLIGGITLIATGTLLLAYFQFACGMFKIASYRIEQAMTITDLRTSNTEKETLVCRKIIYAVDIHRSAMEFIKFYMSKFQMFYICLIGALVITMSLNLFRKISSGCELMEIAWPFTFLSMNYIYMFLANDSSQRIMDHNDNIYVAVYNTKWYIAPLHTQKLVLFLLQRGAKAFKVTIGGLFVGSLENAAMMTSASITYFTVLYSTK